MTIKPRTNLAIDMLIFVLFIVVMVSGLVMWLVLGGGYQGGHNPAATSTFLLLARNTWKDLHIWAGLAMGGMVALHLVLHLKWITCTVERLFKPARKPSASCPPLMQEAGK
jgi:uncharacterized iron-regulated membrane protein